MTLRNQLPAYTLVDEDQAEELSTSVDLYIVEVKPPRTQAVPATLEDFVRGILEVRTGLAGVRNLSPVVVYEITRPEPDEIRLQFCVPSKRLERKVRTHLADSIPGVGFERGLPNLPVEPGDSIGGGLISTGRKDRYPLETEFENPPMNGVVSSLHRHAMMDSKFVIQILIQPIIGRSLGQWWRKRRSYQTAGFLRKEKEELWGSRTPTPREKQQADAVEQKIDQRLYWTSVRIAVIGAEEYTAGRVKEVAGGFNRFENPETGQYLDAKTLRWLRETQFVDFFRSIRDRKFGGYSHRFQATVSEVAGLMTLPDRKQENLRSSSP